MGKQHKIVITHLGVEVNIYQVDCIFERDDYVCQLNDEDCSYGLYDIPRHCPLRDGPVAVFLETR